MDIWVCNGCHAEIPQQNEPRFCPLCGQGSRGFDKGFRPDKKPDDEEISKRYKKALKKLEEYEEGCEPRTLSSSCEC